MTDALLGALTVVGIGADGWPGLIGPARAAVESAEVVLGGGRQLDLLPPSVGGERIAWPAPLVTGTRRPDVARRSLCRLPLRSAGRSATSR